MKDFVPSAKVNHNIEKKSTSYLANVQNANLEMWKHIITLELLNIKIYQKSHRYLFDNDFLKQIEEELFNRIPKQEFANFTKLCFANQLVTRAGEDTRYTIVIPEELVNILSEIVIKTETINSTLKRVEMIFNHIENKHKGIIRYGDNVYNSDYDTVEFYPEERDIANALNWFKDTLKGREK